MTNKSERQVAHIHSFAGTLKIMQPYNGRVSRLKPAAQVLLLHRSCRSSMNHVTGVPPIVAMISSPVRLRKSSVKVTGVKVQLTNPGHGGSVTICVKLGSGLSVDEE